MNRVIEKYKGLPKEVKASIWFLVCSFLQRGISFIITPVFTRIMSTAEYGAFGTFNSWMNVIMVIVTLDLAAGVYVQGIVKYEKERTIFTSSIQGLTISLVLLWTIVYSIFRDFFNELLSLSSIQMYCMLLIVWSTAVFSIWAAEQRVLLRYKHLVIVTIFSSVLQPVLSIVLVTRSEDKVLARILGITLVNVICYSFFFIIHLIKGKTFFSWKYWKYALVFNIPLVPHFLSQTVLNSSDRIMINNMVGESAAGIYTLGYSIAFIMGLFNTALAQTINPWIFKKIRDERTADIPRIAYLMLGVIGVVNLLLIAFAPDIVKIFAPSEYYDAIWIIPPVAMSLFFTFMSFLFVDFEMYYERTTYVTISTVASALLNILLNFVFIRIYGFLAAGYTTLIGYAIYAILHYIFMCKALSKESKRNVYSTKTLLSISVAFVVVGFILMITYKYSILRYCIIACAMIASVIFRKRILIVAEQLIKLRKEK